MTWKQKHTVPSARANVRLTTAEANRCQRHRAPGEYSGILATPAMAGTDAHKG